MNKLKINFNRIFAQAKILPASADFSDKDELANELEISPDELNYNSLLETHFDEKFREVSRHLQCDSEKKVTIVDLVYVRIVQSFRQQKPSLQAVWIQIDRLRGEVRVHMPSDGGQTGWIRSFHRVQWQSCIIFKISWHQNIKSIFLHIITKMYFLKYIKH